jgi:LmbE family N-acetylglucosaminyl deacetylase
MTHVFVAPHPDDVALSCGGLIASLRELGQNVTIITVFSGNGPTNGLNSYQREALGFGSKTHWPVTEAFNRANVANEWPMGGDFAPPWTATDDRLEATQSDADASAKRFWQRSSWYRRAIIHNESLAGQAVIDTLPTQGATYTEDERFAYFAEASIVLLDLPDAVFRGYEGDDELLGEPRTDDAAPFEALRDEITRLEPQKVYLPLGVGGHVDHQLCRSVGIGLLNESRRWVMPGPEYAGIVTFYEDFPYALWGDFRRLDQVSTNGQLDLPADVALAPEYADVTDQLERKITGIALYESQLDRLFGGKRKMADAVRAWGRQVGALGNVDGFAERYWASERI